MIKQLREMLEQAKNIILEANPQQALKSLATSQTKRMDYFSKLKDSLNFIELISKKMTDELKQMGNERLFDECKNSLKTNSEEIGKKLEECCASLQSPFTVNSTKERLCDEFRKYYYYLEAANTDFPWLNLTSYLETTRSSIVKFIENIKSKININDQNTENIAKPLMELRFFAENITMLSDEINKDIVGYLTDFKKKRRKLTQISNIFEKEEIGLRMIDEYPILRGERAGKMSEKMKKQNNIEYALSNIAGDRLLKDNLKTHYDQLEKKYTELLNMCITDLSKKNDFIQTFVLNCKKIVSDLTRSKKNWTKQIRDSVWEILAHLFTIWTLINVQQFNEVRGIDKDELCLLKPHVGQILAIFRMLGIGYDKSDNETNKKTSLSLFEACNNEFNSDKHLYSNLIQVGTGEGKSVIVAITACVLALFGADVSCTCYSDYLIARDKQEFAELFDALSVTNCIHYGTFNQLCELMLNDKCNLREKVKVMISDNNRDLSGINNQNQSNSSRAKVLIIDEVDVFLSDKFYGGTYQPSCWIKSDVIVSLFDQMWAENKQVKNSFTHGKVTRMTAYNDCAAKYSNHVYILEEAIKDMITALKSYEQGTYLVKDDKIAYVDGENITSNVVFGYNTVWQYYLENDKGRISRTSLLNNVGILVNCGRFSYAEMPLNFAFISGVTGTLSTLAKKEKSILRDTYNINSNTYIASIFGESLRKFDPDNDIKVVDKQNYFSSIRSEIDIMLAPKRSILVFFKSHDQLNDFYNSQELASIQTEVQVLTETDDPKEKQIKVNRSTGVGRVTLVTRAMGRGTDFVCRSQQLISNGGLHVLQTFFSEEESEEVQIMGRTGRQGEPGSYRMILLDTDLEWIVGA